MKQGFFRASAFLCLFLGGCSALPPGMGTRDHSGRDRAIYPEGEPLLTKGTWTRNDCQSFRSLVPKVASSVVAIRATTTSSEYSRSDSDADRPSKVTGKQLKNIISVGTGVVIRPDGTILTNEHVIHGAWKIRVYTKDGRRLSADVLASDRRRDLAMIRVPSLKLPAVNLCNRTIGLGQAVAAIGYPPQTDTETPLIQTRYGVVKALSQSLQSELDPSQERYYADLIETNVPIEPGFSGGPLINEQGVVVGINTAVSQWESPRRARGYAIAIDQPVLRAIESLAAGITPVHGLLGVYVRDARWRDWGRSNPCGAYIARILPHSAASIAGLLEGDIIVAFADKQVADAKQLVELTHQASPSEWINLVVNRDGLLRHSTVRLMPRR